jgi:FkbM family methyltransferase
MKSIIGKVQRKIKKMTAWRPPKVNYKPMVTLGTEYGSWTIPGDFLKEDSVVYLAGAGEDISFDVEVAEKYGCPVHIFDPTPRAKKHFETVVDGIRQDKKIKVNNQDSYVYQIQKEKLDKLIYHDLGLWDKKEELKFYTPKNQEHVSHSALNLQKTEDYFLAKVDRLSQIMKTLGHDHIDLLKIDIEGAEYKVLESIIEDKLKVKVLSVEYDEVYNALDDQYLERIKASVNQLLDYGYAVVNGDSDHNYTFALREEFGI